MEKGQMLAFASDIKSLSVQAADDKLGSIADLLFDDRTFDVQWVVVDTGSWLPGRRFLLRTSTLGMVDARQSSVRLDLTREWVEQRPDLDVQRPLSWQREMSVFGYYNWAPYFGAPALAHDGPFQFALYGLEPPAETRTVERSKRFSDISLRTTDAPHLHSADEVIGYPLLARDDDRLGHIEDVLVDDAHWTVRFLVIDTGNWWTRKKVTIPANQLVRLSWDERSVHVSQTRDEIKAAYEYALKLSDFCGRASDEREVESAEDRKESSQAADREITGQWSPRRPTLPRSGRTLWYSARITP